MKSRLFLFFLFLFSITKYAKSHQDYLFIHADMNIRPTYTIGAEASYFREARMHFGPTIDVGHGPTGGIEVSPFKNFFIVPKLGYQCVFINQLALIKTGVALPTDFSKTDFRWYSGIGLSLINLINISYEYNMPFNSNNMLDRVSRNNVSFHFFIASSPKFKLKIM